MTIIEYLESEGVTIRMASTGAIALPNGDLAFVRERVTSHGKLQIVLTHPPKGGRAGYYDQRFSSRERVLREIRVAVRR
jgi:hypothetical protein